MIEQILLIIGLFILVFATITDIKTKEVPDYLNYSIIVAAFGLRLLYSISKNEWSFLLYGTIGFGVFVGIGYLMFYTGQWGGGDSKLLMAVGVVFATYPTVLLNYFNPKLNWFFPFILILNLLIVGGIYGLIYSGILAIKNRAYFSKEHKKLRKKRKMFGYISVFATIILIITGIFSPGLLLTVFLITVGILIFLFYQLWLFAKAVENGCMLVWTPTNKLIEGDWIAKAVKYKNKIICGPKDLGIEKNQIRTLKKYKIKNVLVKHGIAFVPPFLISIIISLIWGNILFSILL